MFKVYWFSIANNIDKISARGHLTSYLMAVTGKVRVVKNLIGVVGDILMCAIKHYIVWLKT